MPFFGDLRGLPFAKAWARVIEILHQGQAPLPFASQVLYPNGIRERFADRAKPRPRTADREPAAIKPTAYNARQQQAKKQREGLVRNIVLCIRPHDRSKSQS